MTPMPPATQRSAIRAPAVVPLLLALALGGAACAPDDTSSSDDTRYPVSAEGAPALGPDSAPVTLVEFVDIQCPYCSVSARRVKALQAAHPSELRVVFRHYPIPSLHPRAIPAALTVECAEEQGLFWEMLDRLVAQDASLDDDTIAGHVRDLGMDEEAFDACVASGEAMGRINADWQMGIDLGIHATPTIYINGLKVVGLQSSMNLELMFSQELKRVEAEAEPDGDGEDGAGE